MNSVIWLLITAFASGWAVRGVVEVSLRQHLHKKGWL